MTIGDNFSTGWQGPKVPYGARKASARGIVNHISGTEVGDIWPKSGKALHGSRHYGSWDTYYNTSRVSHEIPGMPHLASNEAFADQYTATYNGGHPCTRGCGCISVGAKDEEGDSCVLPRELVISLYRDPLAPFYEGVCSSIDGLDPRQNKHINSPEECLSLGGDWTPAGYISDTNRNDARKAIAAGLSDVWHLTWENGAWRGVKSPWVYGGNDPENQMRLFNLSSDESYSGPRERHFGFTPGEPPDIRNAFEDLRFDKWNYYDEFNSPDVRHGLDSGFYRYDSSTFTEENYTEKFVRGRFGAVDSDFPFVDGRGATSFKMPYESECEASTIHTFQWVKDPNSPEEKPNYLGVFQQRKSQCSYSGRAGSSKMFRGENGAYKFFHENYRYWHPIFGMPQKDELYKTKFSAGRGTPELITIKLSHFLQNGRTAIPKRLKAIGALNFLLYPNTDKDYDDEGNMQNQCLTEDGEIALNPQTGRPICERRESHVVDNYDGIEYFNLPRWIRDISDIWNNKDEAPQPETFTSFNIEWSDNQKWREASADYGFENVTLSQKNFLRGRGLDDPFYYGDALETNDLLPQNKDECEQFTDGTWITPMRDQAIFLGGKIISEDGGLCGKWTVVNKPSKFNQRRVNLYKENQSYEERNPNYEGCIEDGNVPPRKTGTCSYTKNGEKFILAKKISRCQKLADDQEADRSFQDTIGTYGGNDPRSDEYGDQHGEGNRLSLTEETVVVDSFNMIVGRGFKPGFTNEFLRDTAPVAKLFQHKKWNVSEARFEDRIDIVDEVETTEDAEGKRIKSSQQEEVDALEEQCYKVSGQVVEAHELFDEQECVALQRAIINEAGDRKACFDSQGDKIAEVPDKIISLNGDKIDSLYPGEPITDEYNCRSIGGTWGYTSTPFIWEEGEHDESRCCGGHVVRDTSQTHTPRISKEGTIGPYDAEVFPQTINTKYREQYTCITPQRELVLIPDNSSNVKNQVDRSSIYTPPSLQDNAAGNYWTAILRPSWVGSDIRGPIVSLSKRFRELDNKLEKKTNDDRHFVDDLGDTFKELFPSTHQLTTMSKEYVLKFPAQQFLNCSNFDLTLRSDPLLGDKFSSNGDGNCQESKTKVFPYMYTPAGYMDSGNYAYEEFTPVVEDGEVLDAINTKYNWETPPKQLNWSDCTFGAPNLSDSDLDFSNSPITWSRYSGRQAHHVGSPKWQDGFGDLGSNPHGYYPGSPWPDTLELCHDYKREKLYTNQDQFGQGSSIGCPHGGMRTGPGAWEGGFRGVDWAVLATGNQNLADPMVDSVADYRTKYGLPKTSNSTKMNMIDQFPTDNPASIFHDNKEQTPVYIYREIKQQGFSTSAAGSHIDGTGTKLEHLNEWADFDISLSRIANPLGHAKLRYLNLQPQPFKASEARQNLEKTYTQALLDWNKHTSCIRNGINFVQCKNTSWVDCTKDDAPVSGEWACKGTVEGGGACVDNDGNPISNQECQAKIRAMSVYDFCSLGSIAKPTGIDAECKYDLDHGLDFWFRHDFIGTPRTCAEAMESLDSSWPLCDADEPEVASTTGGVTGRSCRISHYGSCNAQCTSMQARVYCAYRSDIPPVLSEDGTVLHGGIKKGDESRDCSACGSFPDVWYQNMYRGGLVKSRSSLAEFTFNPKAANGEFDNQEAYGSETTDVSALTASKRFESTAAYDPDSLNYWRNTGLYPRYEEPSYTVDHSFGIEKFNYIEFASNTSPIVITSKNHGLKDNDTVMVRGVNGNFKAWSKFTKSEWDQVHWEQKVGKAGGDDEDGENQLHPKVECLFDNNGQCTKYVKCHAKGTPANPIYADWWLVKVIDDNNFSLWGCDGKTPTDGGVDYKDPDCDSSGVGGMQCGLTTGLPNTARFEFVTHQYDNEASSQTYKQLLPLDPQIALEPQDTGGCTNYGFCRVIQDPMNTDAKAVLTETECQNASRDWKNYDEQEAATANDKHPCVDAGDCWIQLDFHPAKFFQSLYDAERIKVTNVDSWKTCPNTGVWKRYDLNAMELVGADLSVQAKPSDYKFSWDGLARRSDGSDAQGWYMQIEQKEHCPTCADHNILEPSYSTDNEEFYLGNLPKRLSDPYDDNHETYFGDNKTGTNKVPHTLFLHRKEPTGIESDIFNCGGWDECDEAHRAKNGGFCKCPWDEDYKFGNRPANWQKLKEGYDSCLAEGTTQAACAQKHGCTDAKIGIVGYSKCWDGFKYHMPDPSGNGEWNCPSGTTFKDTCCDDDCQPWERIQDCNKLHLPTKEQIEKCYPCNDLDVGQSRNIPVDSDTPSPLIQKKVAVGGASTKCKALRTRDEIGNDCRQHQNEANCNADPYCEFQGGMCLVDSDLSDNECDFATFRNGRCEDGDGNDLPNCVQDTSGGHVMCCYTAAGDNICSGWPGNVPDKCLPRFVPEVTQMGEQGIISCCDCIPCKINGKFTSTCHVTEGSCRNAGGTVSGDGSGRGRVNPGGAGCVEVSGNESSFSAGDSTPENFVRNCWGPVHGEVSGCPGMGFDKNIPMHFNGDHWATEWFPIVDAVYPKIVDEEGNPTDDIDYSVEPTRIDIAGTIYADEKVSETAKGLSADYNCSHHEYPEGCNTDPFANDNDPTFMCVDPIFNHSLNKTSPGIRNECTRENCGRTLLDGSENKYCTQTNPTHRCCAGAQREVARIRACSGHCDGSQTRAIFGTWADMTKAGCSDCGMQQWRTFWKKPPIPVERTDAYYMRVTMGCYKNKYDDVDRPVIGNLGTCLGSGGTYGYDDDGKPTSEMNLLWETVTCTQPNCASVGPNASPLSLPHLDYKPPCPLPMQDNCVNCKSYFALEQAKPIANAKQRHTNNISKYQYDFWSGYLNDGTPISGDFRGHQAVKDQLKYERHESSFGRANVTPGSMHGSENDTFHSPVSHPDYNVGGPHIGLHGWWPACAFNQQWGSRRTLETYGVCIDVRDVVDGVANPNRGRELEIVEYAKGNGHQFDCAAFNGGDPRCSTVSPLLPGWCKGWVPYGTDGSFGEECMDGCQGIPSKQCGGESPCNGCCSFQVRNGLVACGHKVGSCTGTTTRLPRKKTDEQFQVLGWEYDDYPEEDGVHYDHPYQHTGKYDTLIVRSISSRAVNDPDKVCNIGGPIHHPGIHNKIKFSEEHTVYHNPHVVSVGTQDRLEAETGNKTGYSRDNLSKNPQLPNFGIDLNAEYESKLPQCETLRDVDCHRRSDCAFNDFGGCYQLASHVSKLAYDIPKGEKRPDHGILRIKVNKGWALSSKNSGYDRNLYNIITPMTYKKSDVKYDAFRDDRERIERLGTTDYNGEWSTQIDGLQDRDRFLYVGDAYKRVVIAAQPYGEGIFPVHHQNASSIELESLDDTYGIAAGRMGHKLTEAHVNSVWERANAKHPHGPNWNDFKEEYRKRLTISNVENVYTALPWCENSRGEDSGILDKAKCEAASNTWNEHGRFEYTKVTTDYRHDLITGEKILLSGLVTYKSRCVKSRNDQGSCNGATQKDEESGDERPFDAKNKIECEDSGGIWTWSSPDLMSNYWYDKQDQIDKFDCETVWKGYWVVTEPHDEFESAEGNPNNDICGNKFIPNVGTLNCDLDAWKPDQGPNARHPKWMCADMCKTFHGQCEDMSNPNVTNSQPKWKCAKSPVDGGHVIKVIDERSFALHEELHVSAVADSDRRYHGGTVHESHSGLLLKTECESYKTEADCNAFYPCRFNEDPKSCTVDETKVDRCVDDEENVDWQYENKADCEEAGNEWVETKSKFSTTNIGSSHGLNVETLDPTTVSKIDVNCTEDESKLNPNCFKMYPQGEKDNSTKEAYEHIHDCKAMDNFYKARLEEYLSQNTNGTIEDFLGEHPYFGRECRISQSCMWEAGPLKKTDYHLISLCKGRSIPTQQRPDEAQMKFGHEIGLGKAKNIYKGVTWGLDPNMQVADAIGKAADYGKAWEVNDEGEFVPNVEIKGNWSRHGGSFNINIGEYTPAYGVGNDSEAELSFDFFGTGSAFCCGKISPLTYYTGKKNCYGILGSPARNADPDIDDSYREAMRMHFKVTRDKAVDYNPFVTDSSGERRQAFDQI